MYSRTIGGASYLYAKVPVAGSRRDTFIGRGDDPEIQLKADGFREAAASAKGRRATIRTLKARGFRTPDPWMGRFLDAVADAGLFDQGVVVVGTGAYQMMEPLVGHFLPDASLLTGDLDLVTADLAIRAADGESMEAILQRADPTVSAIPGLDLRQLPSRFKGRGTLVELLAPVLRRTDATPLPLREPQAAAAPLQYLRWLVREPVDATALWAAGIRVPVPAPARYAVHKLILAQKRNRTSREKRGKDLDQAAALIAALRTSDPFALEDAPDDARGRGARGWAEPIARSLAELGIDDL